MKPLGMTPTFQIVKPTPAEDAIWSAVGDAINAGMTVEDFRRECREAWRHILDERRKSDDSAWAKP